MALDQPKVVDVGTFRLIVGGEIPGFRPLTCRSGFIFAIRPDVVVTVKDDGSIVAMRLSLECPAGTISQRMKPNATITR